MDRVPRAASRELFESVVRNTDFFGEFWLALGYIEQPENPYMWLFAEVAGLQAARVLVTDRHLVIFQERLFGIGARRLALVASHDLRTLSSASVAKTGDVRTSLGLAFDGPVPGVVSLDGLEEELAEKVRKFLTLSEDERSAAAERQTRAKPIDRQEPASTVRQSEIRGRTIGRVVREALPGLFFPHTTKRAAYLGFGISHSIALGTFVPVTRMLDYPFTVERFVPALGLGVLGILLLLFAYFGPVSRRMGPLSRIAAWVVFLLLVLYASRPSSMEYWVTPSGWGAFGILLSIPPALLGALLGVLANAVKKRQKGS